MARNQPPATVFDEMATGANVRFRGRNGGFATSQISSAQRTDADIRAVAERLGAQLKRVGPAEWIGPCPRCGGRDRFSINTAKACFNCRGCGVGGDAIALARHVLALNFADALAFVGGERANFAAQRPQEPRWQAPTPEPQASPPDRDKAARAASVWHEAVDPRGTAAEVYLNFRGLALFEDIAGRVIRWHAGAGAMVALFRNIATGEPQAVSRTYLSAGARKLDRKFLGSVGAAAIMFDAASNELTVAEGVETGMTARAFGMGPTWACGSAGAIGALPVIPGVQRLRILIEDDTSGASQRAAVVCSERWRSAGRQVSFKLPPARCGDLNDAIRGDVL